MSRTKVVFADNSVKMIMLAVTVVAIVQVNRYGMGRACADLISEAMADLENGIIIMKQIIQ